MMNEIFDRYEKNFPDLVFGLDVLRNFFTNSPNRDSVKTSDLVNLSESVYKETMTAIQMLYYRNYMRIIYKVRNLETGEIAEGEWTDVLSIDKRYAVGYNIVVEYRRNFE